MAPGVMKREGNKRWSNPCHASSFLFFFFNFIYLLLTVLGLCCCVGFSLVVAIRVYSLVAMHGFLIAVVSLVAEHGL